MHDTFRLLMQVYTVLLRVLPTLALGIIAPARGKAAGPASTRSPTDALPITRGLTSSALGEGENNDGQWAGRVLGSSVRGVVPIPC